MSRTPVIAVDFDNTIVEWIDGEQCAPKKGVIEALNSMRERGYHIAIYTCRVGIAKQRGNLDDVLASMQNILDDLQIPYDSIDLGTKLVADAYIDDRAIAFRGDWDSAMKDLDVLMSANAHGEN